MKKSDPREKVALFIDGVDLFATAKALGFDVDYRRLVSHYRETTHLVRAYYYTALSEEHEFNSLRPLIDWLNYNAYTVVTKPVKEFRDEKRYIINKSRRRPDNLFHSLIGGRGRHKEDQ